MAATIKSWGFDEDVCAKLVEIFDANDIGEKNISKLTPAPIKEMIPKIGLRAEFLEKWTLQYGRHDKHTAEQSVSDTESTGSVDKEATTSSSKNPYALKHQDAFLGKTMFAMRSKRIDIKAILRKTIQGQAIVASYKKTKMLTRKSRNIVVDIILSEILTEIPRLTNEDFEHLSERIVHTFPTEVATTYYISPIAKKDSRTHKSIVSRGKLVDKYRNKIREIKKLTGLAPSVNVPDDTASDEDPEGAVAEAVSWLRKHTEPWEIVVAKWKLTTDFRRKDNASHQDSKVCDLFERWPILKHPTGYYLIEEDYASLKLSATELTQQNFSSFYTNLANVRPIKKDDSNGHALKLLLEQEDLTDDSTTVLQLLMLPHIIPPKSRAINSKKNHWKPSISECKDSIIMHAVLPADTVTLQEKRFESMQNLGLSLQPFMIAVGSSLCDVTTFYVCIDKVLYKVPSALKALEICFKAFHALEAEYPPESNHLWLLIQKGLYKFSTRWDRNTPYITEVLTDIASLDKENVSIN